MVKLFKQVLCLLIALTICVGGGCIHVHDQDCGYNPETNTECEHAHPIDIWEPPIG